ncbi:hypothetical protein GGR54DRAFT_389078 [Hypoxylon sp. NC1633]|nr:hypothetical protein GGR54DRAFT_389078 [Hypoxylon sp. NC1633]
MVFPRRGCTTCKRRRIKCDVVRPVCGRCQKATRDCVWDQNEEAGLLFKSENAFAQGKPRRPWKSREREDAADDTQAPDVAPLSPMSLSVGEDDVFRFWADNFLFREDEIPEFARDSVYYTLTYRDRAKPGSSLCLAVSAYSHASYGRAMQVDEKIVDAERLFAKSILIMQSEIHEPTQDNIDELLVTTMLMAYYENVMYGDERHLVREREATLSMESHVVGARFWEDVCHHEGAAGLLKLRQQREWTPNLPLDRAVRRQLIRTCILRGIPVAPWLLNGAHFGEEGPVLEFDSIMVRVAALRARSLCLFLPKSHRFSDQPHPGDIAAEARELSTALDSWSQDIPDDWNFSTRPDPTPGLTFDGLAHVYANYGHTAVWSRYRAVHMVVNSIRKRALTRLEQCSAQAVSAKLEQDICLEKTALLATDLCRGASFFLSTPLAVAQDPTSTRTIKIGDNVVQTNDEVVPKLGTLLAWPLSLAANTDGVPEPQRRWLKSKLKSAADSMGDAILTIITEQSDFRF